MNSEEDEFRRIEAEAKRRAVAWLAMEGCVMTNRQVMQQALECIERCNQHGWILADYEDEVYASIDALKAALAQPEQEPTQWRDMIVATLVREGIDKHRARELADHFAAERNNG